MDLHLNLHRKWFDEHLKFKDEEYRAITPYWCNKLLTYKGEIRKKWFWEQLQKEHKSLFETLKTRMTMISDRKYDNVVFSNGMKPIDVLPRFKKEYLDLRIGYGNPNWGAGYEMVFILKCGSAKEKSNC